MLTMLYGSMVGLALGLTGGGGSILAVPLLLYAAGMPLRDAVTVSLGVVGLTALYGAVIQRRLVRWRRAWSWERAGSPELPSGR